VAWGICCAGFARGAGRLIEITPLLYRATVYTQLGKPDPQLTLQPTNQNLTLALPKGKSFPLLSKERDRFCVAEPG
jgi:hypothetical protein